MASRPRKRSASSDEESEHKIAAKALKISDTCTSISETFLLTDFDGQPDNLVVNGQGERTEDEEGEGEGEGSEREETDGRDNLLQPMEKKKKKKTLKEDVCLPLKTPLSRTFSHDGNRMEWILRPEKSNNWKLSIHLKSNVQLPVFISLCASLFHRGKPLWNGSCEEECNSTNEEFCCVEIPNTVLQQCKEKVELHLSM